MVEFKVVDQGSDKRPVVLQEIGKQPSKFFISETQKKAKVERQRNLLLMAVAYSANIGGMEMENIFYRPGFRSLECIKSPKLMK